MRRARQSFWVLFVFGACVGLAPQTGGGSPGEGLVGKVKEKGGKAATPGKPRPLTGEPMLRIYPVPAGQAEAIATALQKIYPATADVKIAAVGATQVMAYTTSPETQFTIARHLQQLVIEVAPLTTLDAARTVELLRGMFDRGGAGGLFLDVDRARNALVLRGTRDQLEEIKQALRALGEAPPARTANLRIITLEKGSAATLAEALQRLLRQMRPNPVRVVVPGQKEAPAPKPGPQPPKGGAKPADKVPAPVTLTAVGNKLIVGSDDPQVLALAQELVRLLVHTDGSGDFEVIRLRHASATAVALTLDEAFNGPHKSEGRGPAPRAERIRVVADPVTNSLLLKASPLDLLTIRRLLEKALDVEAADAAPVVQTRLIGPLKHAQAAEVAQVVRAVYGEGAARSGAPDARPRIALSVGVDARTNSLVIRGTPALQEEIVALVERLDKKAPPK